MKRFLLILALVFLMSMISVSSEEYGNKIYYWSFNGHGREYSKERLDVNYYDDYDYSDGKVGKALDVTDGAADIRTDVINCDFERFTMAAWVYLDEDVPGSPPYQIVMAKDTKVPGHFEIFFMAIEDKWQLKVYSFDLGEAIEVEEPLLEVGQWLHIAATFDGRYQKLYLNGKEAYSKEYDIGLVSSVGNSVIAFGALVEGDLKLFGKIDEAILANYAFDADLIALLHDNPEEGSKEIMDLIEKTYPEGETPRPDVTPTPESTPEPTTTAEETEVPKATSTAKTQSPKKDKDNTYLVPVIIGGTVVIAGVVLFLTLGSRKKK
ncbi:MAG TPA: LamG domain-containing protein [Clostridia bacterium]|nr:LamG domain-containing protein [Clostridia bacterium]